jgi:hypothetical protein
MAVAVSNFPPYPGGGQPEYPGYQSGPPPYPRGPSLPPGRPQPPGAVRNAVKAMYAGAVLSLVAAVVAPLTRHNIRSLVVKASPHATLTSVNHTVNVLIITAAVAGVVDAGLWIWMSVANGRGHSWARITGTVFFAISTLSVLVGITQHTASISKLLAVVQWLVGLSTVILLWRPESSAFFNRPQYGQP